MRSQELRDNASIAALEAGARADRARTANIEAEHLTFNEAAEWLRCSARTLQRLLEDGSGPPVIRLSERRLIFRLADLRAWLAQRTRGAIENPQPRRGGPRKPDLHSQVIP
jgi:excisionase family DNA binding protein